MYLVEIIDVILRGLAVGLAASITVGPVAVLCIKRTLARGRHAGMMSGLGVACADVLMSIIAYFFYAMLQSTIEEYDMILKVGGGIVVIIIGVGIFLKKEEHTKSHNKQLEAELEKPKHKESSQFSSWQNFVSMFGFSLANFIIVIPYILVFFAMFGVGSASETPDLAAIVTGALTIVGFFGGAVLWWFLLTCIISLFHRRFHPRHMVTINRIAGIIICVLGIYTILSTFFSLTFNGIIVQ